MVPRGESSGAWKIPGHGFTDGIQTKTNSSYSGLLFSFRFSSSYFYFFIFFKLRPHNCGIFHFFNIKKYLKTASWKLCVAAVSLEGGALGLKTHGWEPLRAEGSRKCRFWPPLNPQETISTWLHFQRRHLIDWLIFSFFKCNIKKKVFVCLITYNIVLYGSNDLYCNPSLPPLHINHMKWTH